MDKLNMNSKDILSENLQFIESRFPNVITESKDENGKLTRKIDFELLMQELSSDIVDGNKERYQLTWPGKKEAILNANTPINKTLRPVIEDSVDFENTENLYIEGDNLEVLKLLQESYLGKIKCIYIDPPYNTGGDFIYKDNFSEEVYQYLDESGQIDEVGNKLFQNIDTNGRFHSDWLSMIYSRLKLSKNLLKDDGLIFISIDDNELSNLIKISNEIFGEGNYINQICIKTKPTAGASGGGEDKRLKKNVEYILCYCKSKQEFIKFNDVYEEYDLFELIEDMRTENKSWKYTRALISFGEKSYYDTIKDGSGEDIVIYKHENVIIKNISDLIKEEISEIIEEISDKDKKKVAEKNVYNKYFNKIFRDTNAQSSIRTRVMNATDEEDTFYSIEYIPRSGRNKGKLTTQYYKGRNKDLIAWLSDISEKKGANIIKKEKLGTLWNSFNWNNITKEGYIKYSNGKKPIDMIKRIVELSTSSNSKDIVLDFFAGSSSTAHAVMQMNSDDNGNRKYIMVQLPENLNRSFISATGDAKKQLKETISFLNSIEKPLVLSELGKERIRRAGQKIKQETNADIDYGFRVYKVDSTNMKDTYYNIEEISQTNLFETESNIKADRTPEDLLTQVILDLGLELSLKIEQKDINGKKVFYVDEDSLVACFDEGVDKDLATIIAKDMPMKVVFRDSCFINDSEKENIKEIFKKYSPDTDIKVL